MKKQSRRKPKQQPRLYSCTQQNAVSVSKLAWGYCLALINRFFNFSNRYTAELVTAMIQQAAAADALPNKAQRTNAKRTAHVELVDANAVVCQQWQTLKRYILVAYDKSLHDIKLDAAGFKHYRHAKNNKWEFTMSLIKDANDFMAAFNADLVAKNNMPTNFPTVFGDAATVFVTERNRFTGDSQSAMDATDVKAKAIYDMELELSNLLSAGKVIFEKEPENLRKFTFTNLIKEVRGNEPAGLKGYLVSESNQRPIEGVVVTAGDYSTISDANGKYKLRMPSGTYDIQFEKEGFQPLVLQGRKVKVGVMGRYNAEMQAEQPGQASGSGAITSTADATASDNAGQEQAPAGS